MLIDGEVKLSLQKSNAYKKFSEVIQWGRENPVLFAEHMFGIKLMDYQKYVFMETWTKPFSIWLMSRAAGKTALIAVYLMSKMTLIPNWKTYVAGTTHAQARISFQKLEAIACGREPSFKEVNDIFLHEIKPGHGGERFKHAADGYHFSLFNNSSLETLSSNIDAIRGRRGCVWVDEGAFVLPEFYAAVEPFTNVDSSYSLSVNDTGWIDPPAQPLQRIYTSSAGPISYPFYHKLKEYTKHMLAGDPNYFACNLDVYTILDHTTVDGIPRKSHLSREDVEGQIKNDPEAAERELFNHFRRGAGSNSVLPDDVLIRNTQNYLPILYNDTDKRKFIFAYDPARNYDNSILGIFELVHDERIGYWMRVVNMISMADVRNAKKTPLPMPRQIEKIWDAMIAYNGTAPEWENVEIYADAGAGGGPRSGVFDHMMDPYVDDKGIQHRGIIDPVDPHYEEERLHRKENAQIVHLLEPTKYKPIIFGAFEELSVLNLIKFPAYDGFSDSILVSDGSPSGYYEHKLTVAEKESLMQIELAKTEMSYIVRSEVPATRRVSYELTKEKRRTMHDDRAYVLALGAYALWVHRDKERREIKKEITSPLFVSRQADPYGRNKARPKRPGVKAVPNRGGVFWRGGR